MTELRTHTFVHVLDLVNRLTPKKIQIIASGPKKAQQKCKLNEIVHTPVLKCSNNDDTVFVEKKKYNKRTTDKTNYNENSRKLEGLWSSKKFKLKKLLGNIKLRGFFLTHLDGITFKWILRYSENARADFGPSVVSVGGDALKDEFIQSEFNDRMSSPNQLSLPKGLSNQLSSNRRSLKMSSNRMSLKSPSKQISLGDELFPNQLQELKMFIQSAFQELKMFIQLAVTE